MEVCVCRIACVVPFTGGGCFPRFVGMGTVGCSYWNTKYGVGNEGESASVYFLNVGRCLPPQTEGDRWPSKINCT